jgi:hopene-associated glycosyltransferase HpnB
VAGAPNPEAQHLSGVSRAAAVVNPYLIVIAAVPLLVWLYLLFGRGGFWRLGPRAAPPAPPRPCKVVVLIPARNEASVIGAAVTSLARQRFTGTLDLIVIDDGSSDGTVAAAEAAGRDVEAGSRMSVSVIQGASLLPGWTGKLWALSQGVSAAAPYAPDYLLFTDADIEHGPLSVESLVAEAQAHDRDLVSRMVRLSTDAPPERLLIPAFVFFFFKLYPPAWIASPGRKTAAAAGGCILIRPRALERIGGLQSIRSQIIDDCALARNVKASGGRLSLALTQDARSLRGYPSFEAVGSLISRTAFAQLGHSYLALAGTLLAMAVTYLLPPALILAGDPVAATIGAATLLLMSLSYLPMIRFYGLFPLWCLCLPLIALFYMGAVIQSAVQYARGRGGRWKGRVQDAID